MSAPESRRVIHVGAVVTRGGQAPFVRQTPSHSLGAVWTIPWGVLEAGETPASPAPWAGTIALVFLCQHISGNPAPDGVETDGARYMGLPDIAAEPGAFEPWSRWLVERVLAGHTGILQPLEGNPFGQEGCIAGAV